MDWTRCVGRITAELLDEAVEHAASWFGLAVRCWAGKQMMSVRSLLWLSIYFKSCGLQIAYTATHLSTE